jgi:hypothetical protein
MKNGPAIRLYAVTALTLVLLFAASPARAQFQPRPVDDPATGERYHIEAAAGFWFPSTEMNISSTALGQIGSLIDFKRDLGLEDQRFSELHLVLRPSKSHKFRLQYIPLSYTQTGRLPTTIIFNGQRYDIGLPVNSTLDWKAWRLGYEYDFIVKDRGFGGFLLDFKYTDVSATLASSIRSDFIQASAPIPTIGGIFRVYPVANVSITGEVSGFSLGWLPDSLIKENDGHYADVDFYGTVNFTNYVGVQVGYRSFDVAYQIGRGGILTDTGAFTVKGLYFGVVARY